MKFEDWPIGLKLRRCDPVLDYEAEVVDHLPREGVMRVRILVTDATSENKHHLGQTYSFHLTEMSQCFKKLMPELLVMY